LLGIRETSREPEWHGDALTGPTLAPFPEELCAEVVNVPGAENGWAARRSRRRDATPPWTSPAHASASSSGRHGDQSGCCRETRENLIDLRRRLQPARASVQGRARHDHHATATRPAPTSTFAARGALA